MRSSELLDSIPTHTMTFDEFSAHALVSCVRPAPDGALSVVDVDGPGWAGLDRVRIEAARSFSAMGYARATASTLTSKLIRMSLDQQFDADCKALRLEPGRPLIFVKEHAAGGVSVKEILRRVYADALLAAESEGHQAGQHASSSVLAGAAC